MIRPQSSDIDMHRTALLLAAQLPPPLLLCGPTSRMIRRHQRTHLIRIPARTFIDVLPLLRGTNPITASPSTSKVSQQRLYRLNYDKIRGVADRPPTQIAKVVHRL